MTAIAATGPTRRRKLASGIWTVEGNAIRFLSFPYDVRSTIVDLGGGGLFVYSPVQWTVAAPLLRDLGRVDHIVPPNLLHHLFLGQWQAVCPHARLYAPPGLAAKRPDLVFHAELGDRAEVAWSGTLEQRIVRGSVFMEEAIFFHVPSRTLLVGDVIENHDPARFGPLHRLVARANAMLAPNGTTPRNYRATFLHRAAARATIREVLGWKPRRVVPAHGPCVEDDVDAFLRHAFDWLLVRS